MPCRRSVKLCVRSTECGGASHKFVLLLQRGDSVTQVQVRPNESLDSALKRFKKQLQQTGILKEAREHEHYEKPSDKRRKAEAASRRKRLSDARKAQRV